MLEYKLQQMPEKMGDGEQKVYPKAITYSVLSEEHLIDFIQNYGVNYPALMLKAFISSLPEVMVRVLTEGHAIKLDGLGTFTLSLGFEDEDKLGDEGMKSSQETKNVSTRKVCVKSVNFKVSPSLLKSLNEEADFSCRRSKPKPFSKPDGDYQIRLERAVAFIEKNGSMTLDDYALMNHMNRTAASRELKKIEADSHSGIQGVGPRIRKVWVKK